MSSSKSPCKNAVLTSNCSKWRFSAVTMLKITLMVVIFTTGGKISMKSIPYFCWNPFTTSLALYLLLPSDSFFSIKTHLFCNAFFPFGNLVKDHVLFFWRDVISSFIASSHSIESFPCVASQKQSGSPAAVIHKYCNEGEYLSGGTEILLDFLGGVDGSGSDSTSTHVLWFLLATSLSKE